MIVKHRLNPQERNERAKEIREILNLILNRKDVIGEEFYTRLRAPRAASNTQKDVATKIKDNDPTGRFDWSDREENMGFDELIIRRKDDLTLPFYIAFNVYRSYFNTYFRKPHSLPSKEVITKNECIPFFDIHFLFFNGADIYNPKMFALIDGKKLWDIGEKYWGKLIWIPPREKVWSTERNIIRFDIKRILAVEHRHIIWRPIFGQRKGFGLTKPLLTLLEAIREEVFNRNGRR